MKNNSVFTSRSFTHHLCILIGFKSFSKLFQYVCFFLSPYATWLQLLDTNCPTHVPAKAPSLQPSHPDVWEPWNVCRSNYSSGLSPRGRQSCCMNFEHLQNLCNIFFSLSKSQCLENCLKCIRGASSLVLTRNMSSTKNCTDYSNCYKTGLNS